MRLILILLFVGLFNNLKANNDTIYFDKNWKKCAADTHSFYRLVEIKNNMYHVKDYYGKSHQLQMEGTYSSLDDEIKQGQFYYYFENGNKESEANYINNKKNGVAKYYYETGELSDIENYLDDMLDGEQITYYKNGIIRRRERYSKDKFKSGKLFNENGHKIKFYPIVEMPIYPGGMKKFNKDVAKNIILPEKYLEIGINQKVIVKFIVNKNGMLEIISFLTDQEKDLEEAVIIGLLKTKKWIPGREEGENVNVEYNLPLNFQYNLKSKTK